MRTNKHKRELDLGDYLLLGVVTAISLATCAPVSSAQTRITDQLALARICASEAGLPERRQEGGWRFTDDCAAIYRAISFGAEHTGMRWQGFARAYSGRVFDQTLTTPRAWVAHLAPDGSEPRNWPTQRFVAQRDGTSRVLPHAPWSAYREAWLALYQHAGEVIAGRAIAPCEGPVSDWGGAMDHERAVRIGLIPVVCGTTLNEFWLRPSWSQD